MPCTLMWRGDCNNGFAKAGIRPINRNVFAEPNYVAAAPTVIMLPFFGDTPLSMRQLSAGLHRVSSAPHRLLPQVSRDEAQDAVGLTPSNAPIHDSCVAYNYLRFSRADRTGWFCGGKMTSSQHQDSH